MIELIGVALCRRLNLTQRHSPSQLAIEQGHKLALGAQAANARIRAVFIHKTIETRPRHILQQTVHYAIVVRHGVGPSRVAKHRQVLETK